MKRVVLILIIQFIFLNSYAFISKFLELDTNSMEYQLLIHTEKFDLKTASLLVSGIKPENLQFYLTQINNFEESVKPLINFDNQFETAKTLFNEMHRRLLNRYDVSSTTLDVLLKTGRYNCLSSTVLYSSLLEDFKIPYRAVVLPTHIYSMLTFNGREIDVENTSPYGFDIGTNKEAQDFFRRLTGFAYSHESSQIEVVDNKGIIAYTYGNIAYFASQLGQTQSAFQSALKSLAVYQGGIYVSTNAVAAYSQYGIYLTDVKRDYQRALNISGEAISNLPNKEMFVSNYFYSLDKYLNQIIESNRYADAFNAYDNAVKIVGRNEDIEDNLYTRILYKMINKDRDFTNAFQTGQKFLKEKPGSQNIKNLMINGMNLLGEKLISDWENYPYDEDFILDWHSLFKDANLDIILENYYSDVGIKFYESGNPDRGIEIIKNGLKTFPKSGTLLNNIAYVAGNTANKYFNSEELEKGIYYLKIALVYQPENSTLRDNLKVAYHMLAGKEIDNKNYRHALEIVNEGLKFFPKDEKLLYYKDYIKQHDSLP